MQLDALKGPYQADQLTAELEAVGIRLNQAPPDIYFKQKKGGGLGTVQLYFLGQLEQKVTRVPLKID